jgi:two-component system cell cycle sensor histidine kinase/response regulator CckA
VGVGTTFRVMLPVDLRQSQVQETPAARVAAKGGSETILLVEDEFTVRELVQRFLRKSGYNVLQAASGVEALAVWKQHSSKIGMLLTDMVMPDGINGWELAQTLEKEKPQLKVIFTSGYTNLRETAPDFVVKEGINFVQKPYDPNKLLAIIRATLDAPGSKGQPTNVQSLPNAG